ncbi:hypothetical protein [Bifidobacterium longum]|uniref:Fibronectin type-III domain-containing protein n=1 Tax=Bifidobacterium longum subsp. longum TaxID=1679 RepID=A0A9Q8QUC3_BIFLL|nr:hypothetical protein [Bifidobacterium longum]UNL65063.1 hypothetical protein G8B15_03445 [Bifidobacterium longum subsp. longum]UNL66713.1 hypothetical protein G8B14_01345 [Bifidobacterium longum subsp. longum]UNL68857.1 hypothetical protein G8B13_02145 [Bifidobacterium longum subsp. longum]UNL72143.1 hypothetical protein G8B12_09940 [Bifidobacterium longum subsp. longum]UNL81355.1 hypothetical protein G8B11_02780 [Bifidobacterium longum subsp. longum]
MVKTLHARLVAYLPNGGRLGNLPAPLSWDASIVNNDLGALKVVYSRRAIGGGILKRGLEQGLEIGLEVSDGGAWSEPYNCRYLLIGRSRNAEDVSDTVTLTCQSIGWLTNKILNNDTAHLIQDGDNKGKRAFLSKNPGTIIRTILDENKARKGAGLVLAPGFDTGKDAAGANWKSVYTLYYSLGTSLNSMLSSMVGGGAIDWRTEGRTLRIWNADSTNLSRDLSGRVHVSMAHDVLEAPEEESIEDLSSDILVEGDNGLIFRESNPAAPTPWGGWESYVSQGGVSDEATAKAFMQTTLASAARVRGQYTRSLLVTNAESLPLVDYRPGDWITAPTVQHGEKVRIQQVTVSLDSNGLKASITLNDKVYDSQVRAAKKIKGITGGAALAGSEGGTTASSDRDHRVPKAPLGLIVRTDAYIGGDGYAHGLATAMWSAVTQATNDTAIDISSYRVEWRKHVDGAPWHSAGTTDKTQLGFGGLDCGTQIEVRVRAVPTYSDKLGEWSSIVVATVESDVTPCSVPSEPVLSSELGVVTVHWDGRTAAGASMESDFDHIEVGEGVNAAGMTVISATQSGRGDYLVTGLAAGSRHSYALRSVDHAGNRSGWSAIASVTVASAVSPEEVSQIQKDLADNKTALKDNTAKLDQARKDIQANKSNLDAANQTLSQAKADLSQARKDIAQTKSDLTTANGEISKAKESAAQAYAEAHSKNHTFRGPDMPDASKGLIVGDLWLKTQKYWTRWQGEKNNSPSLLADFYTYWQGTPNNSPSVLVPLADRVIDTLVWDGSKWNHMGYADVENNAKQIEQAKSDIADNAAKTTDAKKTAENAAAAAKTAQGTADSAKSAAGTAQSTADAANAAAKSATTTAGQAKDAANAANAAAESAKKTAGNAETLANTANASANVAKTDASTAKTDAANAKATASNASSVATQAKATADSAAQSATDAANAAQKANTAAAAAAGVANGKADVLIQSTAPDTSMRKPTTLWIDTTGGANTPKRWNGSGWMAVTDKAATDAANAAVKAHAAAQTAQSTADKAQTAAANAAAQANQAQAAAKKAQTTADGKNLIYRGPDEPAHDGLKPGDMWWRTQKYWTRWKGEKNSSPSMLADFYTYWTGAPNASPSVLVPLTDRVIEVLTWDGTRFTPFDLVANNILAAGTVGAKTIAANAVTAEKLSANSVTADKLAANSVTTEKLVADAVTAAKLAANSVQARNIVSLAITTDKLAANSVTTAKLRVTEDMTVALLNVHKIQAGDIVAGAVTTDKIAANAVNADKIAANSVNADKIVSGAITADKLAANSVTAVKIAAGTITSDKVAAGQFKGYVFTGAIFQSSEAANTGVKLNSTALQMWDSNHNRTVYLDGEGRSNVLSGTFQTRTSGHRVRISPDYRTSLVGGTETFVGDGIEFPAYKGETAYWKNPAIASAIQSNQVGEMGELDLWSGRVTEHDPAAFLQLQSKPIRNGGTGSDGVVSRVYIMANTDYDEPDESKKQRASLTLYGDSPNGSNVWLEAADANGTVGVGANIATGYLYLGGFLGGITNRCTFHGAAAWRAWWPNPGQSIATGASVQVNCTFSPTKYGRYYVVANADSQWAGIIAHPVNTGGQSGFQMKLYNADQPCPVDVYAEYLAYLVK